MRKYKFRRRGTIKFTSLNVEDVLSSWFNWDGTASHTINNSSVLLWDFFTLTQQEAWQKELHSIEFLSFIYFFLQMHWFSYYCRHAFYVMPMIEGESLLAGPLKDTWAIYEGYITHRLQRWTIHIKVGLFSLWCFLLQWIMRIRF